MKVAMMQPYLLPSISYFQLLAWADIFVSLEGVNYIKKGWINRNRLLHPDKKKGWCFMTMPIKAASQNKLIDQIEIVEDCDFFQSVLGKISNHQKEAPFYAETATYLRELDQLVSGTNMVADINTKIIEDVASRLMLSCAVIKDKDIGFDRSAITHPQDWAIEITAALNGTAYANPIGGAKLYDSADFARRGITLKLLQSDCPAYGQGDRPFEDRLSIVDFLLWNGFDRSRELAHRYSLFDEGIT